MEGLVDFTQLFLNVGVVRIVARGAHHLGFVLRQIALAQMEKDEVANRVGTRKRVLKLDDRRVDVVLGRIDDAETIMRLLVVRIARENAAIDGFGLVETPLAVVEIAQKARRFIGVGMCRRRTLEDS